MIAKLDQLLLTGVEVSVRGSETRELMHQLVSLTKPLERCIVVPSRNNNVFASIAETMWVIAGRNDIAYLANYLPRAANFSDDGKTWRAGYGPRLRQWHGVDQLGSVLNTLADSPSSRRAVMSIFDPAADLLDSLDIPCTNWLHFTVRDGHLDLNIAVRSNDIIWGFSGINTFEWSVVQEMMAYWLGAKVGITNYFISSLHLYARHFDRATQVVSQPPVPSPYTQHPAVIRFDTRFGDLEQTLDRWFELEAAIRDGANVTNRIDSFPDPMLRDFLRMLSAYRSFVEGDTAAATKILDGVEDGALATAGSDYISWKTATPSRSVVLAAPPRISKAEITRWLSQLHRTKSLAYGDSWKRRGEQMAIMANIARKIDRLALHDPNIPSDGENIIDTAADLLVYSVKYETYLNDVNGKPRRDAAAWSDGTDGFDLLMQQMQAEAVAATHAEATADVMEVFEQLERTFTPDTGPASRRQLVHTLGTRALELLQFHLHKNPAAAYRVMAFEE
ncbi:thymidylate synthase [Subtercola vilae]|nr:thymidylate synthase [Subtercola vilae]